MNLKEYEFTIRTFYGDSLKYLYKIKPQNCKKHPFVTRITIKLQICT